MDDYPIWFKKWCNKQNYLDEQMDMLQSTPEDQLHNYVNKYGQVRPKRERSDGDSEL